MELLTTQDLELLKQAILEGDDSRFAAMLERLIIRKMMVGIAHYLELSAESTRIAFLAQLSQRHFALLEDKPKMLS